MSLSQIVVPLEPSFEDVRKLPGSFVVDLRGSLGLVADYGGEDQRRAWFFMFNSDDPYKLHTVSDGHRMLDLRVNRIEVVAKGLEPIKLDEESALGTLFLRDDGANIVLQSRDDRADRLLFNLVTKRTDTITGEVRLGAKNWTLRAFRDKTVVFEYEVNAYIPEIHMEVLG